MSWELLLKALLSGAAGAALILAGRRRSSAGRGTRRAGQALGMLGVVAALAYFNAGTFHGQNYLHYGELFHYFLGSKYFPELGYDGLYAASLAAQLESDPARPLPPQTRDLRTNVIVPTASLAPQMEEVERRFTPERWRSFVEDHSLFLQPAVAHVLPRLRLDHGYNPSPTWTFVGRAFDRWLPATARTLTLLSLLDIALLVVMFTAVFRVFGSRAGALALILFGLGYAWRYTWVGGAFLRYDWLAAVVLAVCLAKGRRFAAAGAFLAYASAVRIFPVLLLFGVGVVALRSLRRREPSAWAARFAGGFAATLLVCLAAGSLAGRGVQAWPQFAKDIQKHRGTWTTNTEGLELAFLYSPATMTSRIPSGWPLLERWQLWQQRMNQAQQSRRPFYLATAALLLALVAGAAWRASVDEALVLGVVVVFALLVLSCYYWVLLIIVPLRRGVLAPAALLALNAGVCVIGLSGAPTEVIYAVMAWALLAIFVAWLLPDALRTARREPLAVADGPGREVARTSLRRRRTRPLGAGGAKRLAHALFARMAAPLAAGGGIRQ